MTRVFDGPMKALELRVPPPLQVLIVAGAMWGLSRLGTPVTIHVQTRILLAAALLMLGVGVCAAGLLAFRRARTTVSPLKPRRASTLVVSGIYRVSRNPMYLGFALMLLGWAAWLAVPLTLLGVVGFVAYITRFQIVPEERALGGNFGAHFAAYRARVRRWI